MGKPTFVFLDTELGALLLWYTKEAKSAQGLKAAKLIKWNTIVAEGNQPPLLESWTTENEADIERLKKKYIKIGDTAYGQIVALKKKELTAALGKSTKKERDEWRAKINLMDAGLVGEDGKIDLMDTSNAGEDRDEGVEYLFILD